MREQIEGVPVGTKLAHALRPPLKGEGYINGSGEAKVSQFRFDMPFPIIVPDNVYNVIDLSTVPIPEGWERDGETVEDRIVDGKMVPGWFREMDYASDKSYIGQTFKCVYPCAEVRDSRCITGDPRRIHVRRIKPKTRRVLVITIPITDRMRSSSTGAVLECTPHYAEEKRREHPNMIGIEERPL